jgi:RNase P subunit RPR2
MKDIFCSIDLPTDDDGLLPRQCPHCSEAFGINLGMFEQNHYLNLRCPVCGWIAEFDKFHTGDQMEFGRSVSSNEVRRQIENELGSMLEEAFSGVSNDIVEIETGGDDLDMGRESVPSPHLDMKTVEITCSECGFEYAVEQGAGADSDCPVCR